MLGVAVAGAAMVGLLLQLIAIGVGAGLIGVLFLKNSWKRIPIDVGIGILAYVVALVLAGVLLDIMNAQQKDDVLPLVHAVLYAIAAAVPLTMELRVRRRREQLEGR